MVNQRYTELIKKLQNFFDKKNKLIFVHVDIFRSFKIHFRNKKDFFKTHLSFIENVTNSSKLIFPAFNYDFPQKKKFNPKRDASQTDNFTEYYRLNFAKYRTMVPIFSSTFNAKINFDDNTKNINPFGKKSVFHLLYKNNGSIFFYGAPLSASTFIMYVEETFKNGPIYRYKKKISGEIVSKKRKRKINFIFHVRPPEKNYHLEYDWNKLEKVLKKKKLLKHYKEGIMQFKVLNIKTVTNFLHNKLKKDPFYLLDKKSKKWVIPMYKKLNRRFVVDDFKF